MIQDVFLNMFVVRLCSAEYCSRIQYSLTVVASSINRVSMNYPSNISLAFKRMPWICVQANEVSLLASDPALPDKQCCAAAAAIFLIRNCWPPLVKRPFWASRHAAAATCLGPPAGKSFKKLNALDKFDLMENVSAPGGGLSTDRATAAVHTAFHICAAALVTQSDHNKVNSRVLLQNGKPVRLIVLLKTFLKIRHKTTGKLVVE